MFSNIHQQLSIATGMVIALSGTAIIQSVIVGLILFAITSIIKVAIEGFLQWFRNRRN
jgi:hypothetical protein